MDAIRFEENTLFLLDQTKLPNEIIWLPYHDHRNAAEAIRTMIVRGAPAIGCTAAYAMALAGMEFFGKPDYLRNMENASALLAASRPTAVNLFWALDRMEKLWKTGAAPDALISEARAIHQEDLEMCRAMGDFGAEIIPENAGILTHCNAGALATGGYGTALGVIRSAYRKGKVRMVYCDETRPLLQGARLSAFELTEDGIPTTVITDNMAAAMIAAGLIQCVVVGCDRMASNGDFANKIGTYGVAILAKYHGIPFYTALPSSTVDFSLSDGSGIVIEERCPEEVTRFAGTRTAPEKAQVRNPAFDVTPHQLLTGIITEKGVLYPPFSESLQILK